jgi:hypothetical protein
MTLSFNGFKKLEWNFFNNFFLFIGHYITEKINTKENTHLSVKTISKERGLLQLKFTALKKKSFVFRSSKSEYKRTANENRQIILHIK